MWFELAGVFISYLWMAAISIAAAYTIWTNL
jgi:hypothetical protein